MDNPHAHNLGLIAWQFFGTLTFRHEPKSRIAEHKAWSCAWSFFRRVSDLFGVGYPALRIALRSERGEVGGRFHFHFLLSGVKSSNLVSDSFRVRSLWTDGLAHVRPYDASLPGVSYICKGYSLAGANSYERAKFGRASGLAISGAALRDLERSRARS